MATLEQFAPPTKAEVWQGIADAKADAKVRANHNGPLNWAWSTYGGTANAITLAPAYARSAYVVGDEFRFRATAPNTGATTINVGGLGEKAAVTVTGEALSPDYIRTDVDTVCVYDGTKFVVQREIETGTNSNGTYTKFADGTMICTYRKWWNEVVAVGVGVSASLNFAATFVGAPTLIVNASFFTGLGATGESIYALSFGYSTNGRVTYSILNTGHKPSLTHPVIGLGPYAAKCYMIEGTAVGRWK